MPENENKNEQSSTDPIVIDLVGKKLLGMRIAHHRHTGRRVHIHYTSYAFLFFILVFTGLTLLLGGELVDAGPQQTEQASVGLAGTVPGPPPDSPAVITVPTNNTRTSNSTITVKGSCTNALSVEIYRNNVLAGSTICENGAFDLQVGLLPGSNSLKARIFDSLGQYGPDSEAIVVIYETPTPSATLPTELIITAKPAQQFLLQKQRLTVSYTISGGDEPYALAFNWGDGTETEAVPISEEGQYGIARTYNKTGKQTVLINASDALGVKTFFQFAVMVAPASGVSVPSNASRACNSGSTPMSCFASEQIPRLINIAWPALGVTSLMTASFWLGEKIMLSRLRLPRPKI